MNLSPQQANYSAQSTETKKIKKKQRWDDEGVAATIGTIMTLLVFMTFLGMFTNQVLPVMMSDNESSHMSTAIGQFTTLKSTVDISISNYANSLVAPSSIFVPVTLGSPGIPVFAASTAGVLTMIPNQLDQTWPKFSVDYTYKSQAAGNPVTYTLNSSNDGGAGGSLGLYCPNRYYVEETLIYENGAVILNQTDGEFIVAGPQFMVKTIGTGGTTGLVVMFTQISLQGTNKIVGGTGSKGVNANLQFAESKEYDNSAGTTLTFTIVSQHGIAWADYFDRMLNGTANMTKNHGYTITTQLHQMPDRLQNYYTVTVTVQNVKIFDYTRANVDMDIGELMKT